VCTDWQCYRIHIDNLPLLTAPRLAPLSEGRVESDGTLSCAYHGWRFASDGRCTTIPQAADDIKAEATACASRRSCARVYPCKEAYGLIWVWGEAGEGATDRAGVPQGLWRLLGSVF